MLLGGEAALAWPSALLPVCPSAHCPGTLFLPVHLPVAREASSCLSISRLSGNPLSCLSICILSGNPLPVCPSALSGNPLPVCPSGCCRGTLFLPVYLPVAGNPFPVCPSTCCLGTLFLSVHLHSVWEPPSCQSICPETPFLSLRSLKQFGRTLNPKVNQSINLTVCAHDHPHQCHQATRQSRSPEFMYCK